MKSSIVPLLLGFSYLVTADAAVFVRDPGPVASLDLAGGPGGAAKAPKSPFTFVSEEKGGTAPKITVKDANGATWVVKFGEEVKAETFASRIVWAAGYFAEPTYFVPEGKIEGAVELGRTARFVQNGTFRDARFQLWDDNLAKPVGKWNLMNSSLKGSKELAGYKVLMILLSNWDVKPENLAIVNTSAEPMYAVTDWGATMGRSAEWTGRSKWNCDMYAKDTPHLIDGVENGFVLFNHQGKQGDAVARDIRTEDVAWLMERLGKLTDAQIDAALKASGATAEEAACFAPAFRSRLGQLMSVANAKPNEGTTQTIRTRTETKTITRKPIE